MATVAHETKSSNGSLVDEKRDIEAGEIDGKHLNSLSISPTRQYIYPILCLLLLDHMVEEVTDAHFADPNLDRAHLGDLEEDSPYPEVRSAVANTDDPDMPVSTIRVWLLGMIMAIVIPGLNQFL